LPYGHVIQSALDFVIDSLLMLMSCVLGKKEKDVVIETKYTIENVIGNGGFGTVYAGKRKKDGHLVSSFTAMLYSVCRLLTELQWLRCLIDDV